MDVGQRWAYKESSKSKPTEVEIIRLGANAPLRQKVRFIEDEFEGVEKWVPSKRLVTPWADVEELRAEEARWREIHFPGRPRGSERDAAWRVLAVLVPTEIADLYYNGAMGLTEVFDLRRFSAVTERTAEDLRGTRGAFERGSSLLLNWEETRRIVMDLAARFPAELLQEVKAKREEYMDRINELAHQEYFYRSSERNAVYTRLLEEYPMYYDEMYRYIEEWAVGADRVRAERQASLEGSYRELSALALRAVAKLRATHTQKWDRLADEIETAIKQSPVP